MPDNYNQHKQRQEWQEECAEVAAMNFERIERETNELLAKDYDGSDPQTEEVLATILDFEKFIAGRNNNFFNEEI